MGSPLKSLLVSFSALVGSFPRLHVNLAGQDHCGGDIFAPYISSDVLPLPLVTSHFAAEWLH